MLRLIVMMPHHSPLEASMEPAGRLSSVGGAGARSVAVMLWGWKRRKEAQARKAQGHLDIMSPSVKVLECARPQWQRSLGGGSEGSKCAWQPEGGAAGRPRGSWARREANRRCRCWLEEARWGGTFREASEEHDAGGKQGSTHHPAHTTHTEPPRPGCSAKAPPARWLFQLKSTTPATIRLCFSTILTTHTHLCIPSSHHTNTGRSTTYITLLNTATTHFGTVSLILFSF